MRRLNLEEIGRLAGVSRSTVSRVVNGEPNVSPDARARVDAVITATGYRPHAAARSLASKRTAVIGLVIPSAVETLFDDPYFGRLILGISRATNALGLTLSLFLINDAAEERTIYDRVVSPGLVDGLIVTATRMGDPLIENLIDSGTPFIVVGRSDADRPVMSVDVDNRGGGSAAARYLVDLGYRKVAMIGAPSDTTAGVDRSIGFSEVLAEAGIAFADRVVEGDWSEGSGLVGMERLLEDPPEAVFVASDRMAVGALAAIRQAGLRCPDDIAVISFDGLLSEAQATPSLTSVVQPVTEVGDRAARMLHARIEGEATLLEQVVLPVDLVVRESCPARVPGAVPA